MKANRVLGLTLALDATRLGKGINDAVRSLGGFENAANKTAKRISGSLGKSLATELPKDIRRMRLAVRGEGIQLARDQKVLNRELFDNRIRREGIRKQMQDLRYAAKERNRIYNEDVRRIREQRRLEDEQVSHRQKLLRKEIRDRELDIASSGKAANSQLLRDMRLANRESRLVYRQAQQTAYDNIRTKSQYLKSLEEQQRAELLKRGGARAQALRQAQERLLEANDVIKVTKAQNIHDLQTKRKELAMLEKRAKIADKNVKLGGANASQEEIAEQLRANSQLMAKRKEYNNFVTSVRDFNRDSTELKQELSENVRKRQAELRSSLGGTKFDSDIERTKQEIGTLNAVMSGNRLHRQEALLTQEEELIKSLHERNVIENDELNTLNDVNKKKRELLKLDQEKLDLDSKRGRLEYRHGFTQHETDLMNRLRGKYAKEGIERNKLDTKKLGLYNRGLKLTESREKLRRNEEKLVLEQEIRESLQGTFDIIANMATTALVSGFSLLFAADRFKEWFINPALQHFSEFETELTRYRSITGINLSDPKQQELYRRDKELIRKTSLQSGFSGTDTARALSNLISAGLDPEVSRQMLPAVLDVTQASYGEITPDDAGKIMATVFQKFDLSKIPGGIKEQSKYMADWVFQLKQASKLEFSHVEGFLDSLQASPAILRMGTEEIGALGTALMRLGASPRNAAQQINALGPNLAKIMRALSDSVKVKGRHGKLIQEQNKRGYGLSDKDFFNEDGTMKPGYDILRSIYEGYQRSKKSQGAGPAEVGLYNIFQTSRGLNIMRSIEAFEYKTADGSSAKGWDALDKLRREFEAKKIQGISAKAAESFRATPTGLALQFENAKTMMSKAFGGAIFEMVSEQLLGMVNSLNALAEWIDKHPDVAKFISSLGLAFTGLATGLGLLLVVGGAAFFVVSTILSLIGSFTALPAGIAALGGIGAIASTVGTGLAFLIPIALVLTAIAGTLALIPGLVAVSFGGDSIMDAFSKKLEQIKYIFMGLAEMWSDYTTPEELFLKMREAGVWPLVRAILMLKYRAEQFWDGLSIGTKQVRKDLAAMATNLGESFGNLFGTDIEFTDPQKWQLFGFAVGKVLSALFIGAILFLFSLRLLVHALQYLQDEFNKHKELYTALALVLGFALATAVVLITGLMIALGIAILAVTAPFLLFAATALWFYDWMKNGTPGTERTGFLGFLSSMLELIREAILSITELYLLLTNPFGAVINFVNGEEGFIDKQMARRERVKSLFGYGGAKEQQPGLFASQVMDAASGGTPTSKNGLSNLALPGFRDSMTAGWLLVGPPKDFALQADKDKLWRNKRGSVLSDYMPLDTGAFFAMNGVGMKSGETLGKDMRTGTLSRVVDTMMHNQYQDYMGKQQQAFFNQTQGKNTFEFLMDDLLSKDLHPMKEGFFKNEYYDSAGNIIDQGPRQLAKYLQENNVRESQLSKLRYENEMEWMNFTNENYSKEPRQVIIQKVEITAPESVDPYDWAQQLSTGIKEHLSTESE